MDLKKYRRVAGISQGELARRSTVDIAVISRLESGERLGASYENTVLLARTLNLEPEELAPVDLSRIVPVSRPFPIAEAAS
jgi:transcriptional regulator with XRE-family HTH domain